MAWFSLGSLESCSQRTLTLLQVYVLAAYWSGLAYGGLPRKTTFVYAFIH